MSKNRIRLLIPVVTVLTALAFSSCILSPTEEPPPKPTPVWKDLTHKEDVISNMVQSYKVHDITHYQQLLTDEFIWVNNPVDYANKVVSEESYARDIELTRTGGLFDAAEQKYADQNLWIDRLELTISTSPNAEVDMWEQMPDYLGNPCSDCWQTTRTYGITAVFGEKTLAGVAPVHIVIIGTPSNGKTYYHIARMEDLPN